MRIDLHVHSKQSKRPSAWVLQKINCPESFTEPLEIYRIAKERGMTHVTISDHNCIDGALEIAHLPDTFVSEEITTYFPEDRCKVHVLALDINERQHNEIQKIRQDIYDLTAYLREEKIVHVLAHALFAINDRLTLDHFEQFLLLFKNFELNGARNDIVNDCLMNVLNSISPDTIDELSKKHKIEPPFPEPWIKHFTGGSDDHSSLNIARTFTEIPGARTVAEGLQGIETNRSRAIRNPSDPETMAHNFYSIAYQFYRTKFNLGRFDGKDLMLNFLEKSLRYNQVSQNGRSHRIFNKVCYFFNMRRQRRLEPKSDNLFALLRYHTTRILEDNPEFQQIIEDNAEHVRQPEENWYEFVNRLSNRTLLHFADHAMDRVMGGNVFNIFHIIGSAGGLYGMLAPYFIAFSLFSRDRAFSAEIERHVNGLEHQSISDGGHPSIRIAHFTDILFDAAGSAVTVQKQVQIARKNKKQFELITCNNEADDLRQPGIKTFAPIGTYELSEDSNAKIFYPPLLTMMRYCYEKDFTQIHASTPGPIGLSALAVAKIMKLPFFGIYNEQVADYVRMLSVDEVIEDLIWKFVIWFYEQMDAIYVPSESARQELIDKGIQSEKVVISFGGIDTGRFTPDKRNGYFEEYHNLNGETKLLHVGSVTKEKNLELMTQSFKKICEMHGNVHLIVAGDGPYRTAMQKELQGLPCTFTGPLNGEDLAAAYASSDIFVFPSTTDTFGNAILEAQASGLPVIVSDQGGPCENMIHEKTGLVFKGNEMNSLTEAISQLITDSEKRTAMGEQARWFMQDRSHDVAFLKAWRLYEKISPDNGSLRAAAGM